MYKAYFDGAFRRNKMYCGFVVYKHSRRIGEYGKVEKEIGGTTNLAEYRALRYLLEFLVAKNIKSIEIYGDSQAIIYQILGKYNCKAPRLLKEYENVKSLIEQFKKLEISWIPREKNIEADRMTRV